MGHVSWRTQISFLLAGTIFVLCHMIVSGNRGTVDEPGPNASGDRSFQDSRFRGSSLGAGEIETEGSTAEGR